MSYKSKIYLAFILIVSMAQKVVSQTVFYDVNTIQKIEITFLQPDWDYQLDTSKYGSEGYIMASSVSINGVLFDSVGVKYKGNSSYDSTKIKNPLHIELDTYKNQSYSGYKDIKLSNCYSDPSMIREVLAYQILANYMDCPKANFAQVYINGNYIGLYSNDESINKQFLSTYFSSSSNTFIKCNPVVNPGPTTKSNLKYISTDSSQYFNYYEIKSNNGWNDLVKLCDTVTNYPLSIGSVIDVDRVLWMLAFNNVLINLDSYSGAFCQNYYLYKDATQRYNPVVWDLNMAFGGLPFVGSGFSSLGSLSVTNMQQLPTTIHSTDNYWPLIKNIMSDATYQRMYVAHVKTITNEFFANNSYQTLAAQLQSVIDTAVQSDMNKFYSYSDFQNGLTTDVTGSYTIPGISNLMGPRVTYLQSTANFTNIAPIISDIQLNDTTPSIGSNLVVTTNVINTNTNSVYLGYRFNDSEKFTRILMYDDGLHDDGGAGDNIYGISFSMSGLQCQYYIYAENNNVGTFAPERAEYEFYNVNASISVSSPGQIVINEFLAVNNSGVQDEAGQREDWIELYNNTSIPLDLYGLYLSDSYSNLTKYAFPQNTIIQANSYLLIWADEDSGTTSYLHANFKLSSAGEQIIISNIAGEILDSVSFGSQIADQSMGRCSNGTGPFTYYSTPTPDAINCVISVEEYANISDFKIYPNPTNNYVIVDFKENNTQNSIVLFDVTGNIIKEFVTRKKCELIDISDLNSGMYFLRVNNDEIQKLQVVK
ncbi:MAG: CotH kinase family protein [Flavobacteriales bacterium]